MPRDRHLKVVTDMKNILERLKSPVVWAVALTAVYTYIEAADLGTVKGIILCVVGSAAAVFGAINNPTDRDHM